MLMDISSEMIHSLLPLFMVTTLGASAYMLIAAFTAFLARRAAKALLQDRCDDLSIIFTAQPTQTGVSRIAR